VTFLPIVERELRLRSRKRQSYYGRSATALVTMLVSFGTVGLSLLLGRTPGEIGVDLFCVLTGLAFVAVVLAGPLITADCLSEEKREGTLGLLFLTDLRGYDIMIGKLVGVALPACYALLAAVPLLALPFFMGGVMAVEFWRVAATLLGTMVFSLSVGLFVSAVSRDARRALLGTSLVVLGCTLGPLAGVVLPAAGGAVSGWLAALVPCPGLTLLTAVGTQGSLTNPGSLVALVGVLAAKGAPPFWPSLLRLLVASGALLFVASHLLPWVWQDRTVPAGLGPRDTSHRRVMIPWTGGHRQARRARQLEQNPIVWLARRTALHPVATLAFWVLSLVLGWWTLQRWGRATAPPIQLLVVVYALHGAVKCWIAWEASRRFAEDRRSGALELLLTSPVGERAILAGWLTGLKWRLAGPVFMLLVLDVTLLRGSDTGLWLLGMLGVSGLFFADAYTLCWVGLWLGLTARSAARACQRAIGSVLVYPCLTFLGLQIVTGLVARGSAAPETAFWLAAAWVAFSYLWDLTCCTWAVAKLSNDFRAAASRWSATGNG
jgi:hypothetical protein